MRRTVTSEADEPGPTAGRARRSAARDALRRVLRPETDSRRRQALLVVHGNCQAESIRLLLQDADDAPCVSVRVPAVHELTPDEVPFLQRLLDRAAVVLTQPVTAGYHDLPLGASEVQEAAPGGPPRSLARYPVCGSASVAGRVQPRGRGRPTVVPYHDVRTMTLALGEPSHGGPEGFRAVARWSIAELHDREARAGAVPVSRFVVDAGAGASNTVNHPGNPVLVPLARAIQQRLGWPVTATDPGYELLESVQTPCEGKVLEALGIELSDGRDVSEESWVVGGREVPDAEVVDAQLGWYRQHPEVLAAVANRERRAMAPARDDGRMTVRYVVAGPTRHGVVRHALRLGASDPFLSRALVRVPSEVSGHEPPGLRDALPPGSTAFLHVTDRLFGTSPEEAAATVRALAVGSTLALSLHDVPQASEGKEWYQRRRDAYAEFVSAATQLVVASEFEKGLLAACVDDPESVAAVMRKTTVVPLPLETGGSRHPVPDGDSAEIAVLGYLYPGKGVEDVIDAAASMAADGRVVSVVNYGAAAEGHEDLVGQLGTEPGGPGSASGSPDTSGTTSSRWR